MARVFNGTTDHIDLANEANFDFERNQTFSLAVWIYLTGNNGGAIIGKYNGTTGGGWELGLEPFQGPCLNMVLTNTPSSNQISVFSANALVGLNAWHHAGMSYDGSSTAAGTKLYYDGANITTGGGSNPNVDNLSATILNDLAVVLGGNAAGASNFYTGGEAGDAIWNVVLTAAEFATLATGVDPYYVRTQSLVACLDLCGASPEIDKKGGNNGTVTGTIITAGPTQFQGCPSAGDDPAIGFSGRGAGW